MPHPPRTAEVQILAIDVAPGGVLIFHTAAGRWHYSFDGRPADAQSFGAFQRRMIAETGVWPRHETELIYQSRRAAAAWRDAVELAFSLGDTIPAPARTAEGEAV